MKRGLLSQGLRFSTPAGEGEDRERNRVVSFAMQSQGAFLIFKLIHHLFQLLREFGKILGADV